MSLSLSTEFEIECAGEPVILRGDGTVLIPGFNALLVADLHLGKSASFRAGGVPVPEGVDQTILENLTVALATTAIGCAAEQGGVPATVVKAPARRKLSMKSLIPKTIERFPWAGHMGLKSVPAVIEAIESKRSSLIFTNTRSQSEKWYSAILHAKPEWAGRIGLHHGSLDRGKRAWVERELDAGNLHCVVCTSSLDLGVDFFPVEQVMQVGSPKGIARLMQRAGRSGHYPGGKSQLVFVPTHALELIELAAAKDALKQNRIESRVPLTGSLDVLVQHVVTLAAGT
ncbi:helicase-related protein, partial [bacterium]|nr:helicase-related protein [bacterium]